MTVLACDLGGTRMKIGVVQNRRVLAQTIVPANSKSGLRTNLPKLKAAWMDLLGGLKLDVSDCAGISVAFASLVDIKCGRVLAQYGKYADAMDLDLRAWARQEFCLPLAIENDARMALVGEWLAGAGRGCNNLVMITLGTGLGTAAIMNGVVVRGKHGQAGVLGGHFTVNAGGRKCHCGNLGCAEAEASTAFLPEIIKGHPNSAASKMAQTKTPDYADIFGLAAEGFACAKGIRDRSLEIWSALAVNLIHAYDPEVVIVGGGIMASAKTILPAMQVYIHRHAHTPWGKVRVVASELADQSVYAAAEWLLEEQAEWLVEKQFTP